jgi:hypothetical protein
MKIQKNEKWNSKIPKPKFLLRDHQNLLKKVVIYINGLVRAWSGPEINTFVCDRPVSDKPVCFIKPIRGPDFRNLPNAALMQFSRHNVIS